MNGYIYSQIFSWLQQQSRSLVITPIMDSRQSNLLMLLQRLAKRSFRAVAEGEFAIANSREIPLSNSVR